MTSNANEQSPLMRVAGIVGGIGGFVLAQYCGASLLVPGVSTVLLFLLFTKTPIGPRYFRGAIGIIAGHVLWFVAAALILGVWDPVLLDIIVLTVGVIWLCVRPGLIPAVLLGLFELLSLAVNAYTLQEAPVGDPAHRALVVHCLLRLAAIIYLILGYQRLKRERQSPPVPAIAIEPPVAST